MIEGKIICLCAYEVRIDHTITVHHTKNILSNLYLPITSALIIKNNIANQTFIKSAGIRTKRITQDDSPSPQIVILNPKNSTFLQILDGFSHTDSHTEIRSPLTILPPIIDGRLSPNVNCLPEDTRFFLRRSKKI